VDIDKFSKAGFQESGLQDPDMQKAYYYVDTGLIAGNVGKPSGRIHEYQSDQPSSIASSAFARTALPTQELAKKKTGY
jgi:hypothetical protein